MGLQGDCIITVCLLWWCYQGQLHGAEPGLRLSGSQEAASCQQIPSTATHLLHMSIFPLNPSKGFPESSSMSTGPHVFEVMILCVFMALKSLSNGRVVSCVWSKSLFEVLQGTLNVAIGHRPNILELHEPRQLLTTNDDPSQSLLWSIYESEFGRPVKCTDYVKRHQRQWLAVAGMHKAMLLI